MSLLKKLLVIVVVATLILPLTSYTASVEAQATGDFGLEVKSKYPVPHDTTTWLSQSAPLYTDAWTGNPVYDSDTFKVTVSSIGGFSGDVSLSVDAPPALSGVTFTFDPATVSVPAGGSATSTLTVTVTSTTAPGTYTVYVKASSGQITKQVPITIVIQTASDVLIRFKNYPYIVSTIKGSTLVIPVLAISRAGFEGTVMATRLLEGEPIPQPTGFTVDFLTPNPANGAAANILPHSFAEFKIRIKVGDTASFGDNFLNIYFVIDNNMVINGLRTSFDNYLYEKVQGFNVPMFWLYDSPSKVNYVTAPVHTPPSSLLISGPATPVRTTSAYTSFTLPYTLPSLTLSFWYRDSVTGTGDTFSVYIRDSSNNLLFYENYPEATTFTPVSISLANFANYKGQKLSIEFRVTYNQDATDRTINIDTIVLPGFATFPSALLPFSITTSVVGLSVVATQPVYAIPIPLMPGGDFEIYPIGPRSPGTLTVVPGPAPNPYSAPSIPGVWQGKAVTRAPWTPPTYQWSVAVVTTGSPSPGYDLVFEGTRALRIGATPNYPTPGSNHIRGWEVARYGPITLPTGTGPLQVVFNMYVNSQEGSASAADFWDPFYLTIRFSDVYTNPYNPPYYYIPSIGSVYYVQISSINSWQAWSEITITLPDWLKGLTVWVSFEQGHRDPLFRTWRIIDNVRLGIGGVFPLSDFTMLAGGSAKIAGYIEQTSSTGGYTGSVSISATVSNLSTTPTLYPVNINNLLSNGDFEKGNLMGWTSDEDLEDNIPNVEIAYILSDSNVLQGRYSARIKETCTTALCELIAAGYTRLETTDAAYIHPNTTTAYLTFRYKFTGSSFDWLDSFVEIIDADSGRSLATYSISWTSSPTTINIDLSSYRGLNIRVSFAVGFILPLFNPNSAFYLDSVGIYSLSTVPANLLSNGDFELGTLAGWSYSSTSIADFLTDSNVISGRYSAKMTGISSLTSGTFRIGPAADNPYLTFKYRVTGGNLTLEIYRSSPIPGLVLSKKYSPGSGQVNIDLSSLKHSTAIYYIRFSLANPDATAYIDDVGVYAPEKPGSIISITSTTQRYIWDTIVKAPSNTPSGVYKLTLTFEAPLYSPAVESGPTKIVVSFSYKIRIIGYVASASPPSYEFNAFTSDELEVKINYSITAIPPMQLNLESYDVWVSTTSPDSPQFNPYSGSSAARDFGIWLSYPQQAMRVGYTIFPGIYNGDFELGTLAGWTSSGNVTIVSAPDSLSLDYSALMNSTPDLSATLTSSSFMVFTNLTNPVLTFKYKTTSFPAGTVLTLNIVSGNEALLTKSLSESTSVQTVSIDLSGLKSDYKSYQLIFKFSAPQGKVGVWIDDVYLNYNLETTFKVVTQLAKPGKYVFVWFTTNNLTGPYAIPSIVVEVNPPPNQWLYRTFKGLPVNMFNVTVGDAVLTTDTFSLATSAGGSPTFNINVKSIGLPYKVTFSGSAYYFLLGNKLSATGISISFSPSSVNLASGSSAVVQVKVETSTIPAGTYYIDIVAKFEIGGKVTERVISGIKLFVTPASAGGIVIDKPIAVFPENEILSKKIPLYQYEGKAKEDANEPKLIIDTIDLSRDLVSNKELYVLGKGIELNLAMPILTIIVAIGVAIYLSRRFI